MKNMKKILALVLAMLLVLGMTSAMAATITINRDASWTSASADKKEATYTWYRIFDVDLTDTDHPVYTISGANAAAKVAALDSTVFKADLAADGKYYITKKTGVTDQTLFTALGTMVGLATNATLFPGTAVTSATNPVVLDVGDPGYFFIKASNGKDVAVQTAGAATITEKNDYPSIDKKQKKAADRNYDETVIPAEIGSVIDYQITVHIPTDAVGPIAVIDKMSAGLTYNSDFATNPTAAAEAATDLTAEDTAWGYVATAPAGYTIPFQKKFSAAYVEAHRGEDIVITYTATVNTGALVPTGRENEAKLVYDEGNFVMHDTVNYTTYFTGIEKVDGTNTETKLANVTFTLTSGGTSTDAVGNAFNVQRAMDGETDLGYYIPGGSSNVVTTGENGLIIIRGLDNTKVKYYLTETSNPNPGYNLLETPKELTIVEDNASNYSATTTYDLVVNNKGTTLPSTGGIGTTLFYVGGGVLVLLAVVMLVTKKRMKAED